MLDALTVEDIAKSESFASFQNRLHNSILTYYDERTKAKLDIVAPRNWEEDKEVVSVRKRMLKRRLEEKAPIIKFRFDTLMATRTEKINEVLRLCREKIEEFFTTVQLPLNHKDLKAKFSSFQEMLRQFINTNYPDGLAAMDKDCLILLGNDECTNIFKQIDMRQEELIKKNERAIENLKQKYVQEIMELVSSELQVALVKIVDEKVASYDAKLYFLESFEKKRFNEYICHESSLVLSKKSQCEVAAPSPISPSAFHSSS
eukprot:scaffold2821_cov350-Ochromonas_danica.AAC.1